MDFEYHYTEEQERFRKEVRAWIEGNAPENMRDPVDVDDRAPEFYTFWIRKHTELGTKGWLYPTFPKEYGGGGLTGAHETIIEEEFIKAGIPRHFSTQLVQGSLMVWATEEQKQKFLAPLLKGEMRAWQKYTEPQSGADLANYQSTAVREGDEWVLNGSNQFVTGYGPLPDYLFGPMKTDREAPRHRNLGFFMIPVSSPGLSIVEQPMMNNGAQHFVYLSDVRIPADHLIGDDHQGWQVTNTVLEQEHGGRGVAFPQDEVLELLLAIMKEKRLRGEVSEGDPVRHQSAVEAYLDSHINMLFQKRTYWMHTSGLEMSWEGPNTGLYRRDFSLRNAVRVREVLGMQALLGTHEGLAPGSGMLDVNQRTSVAAMHSAGTRNINRVIVARRMGISRTKERAATTVRV